MRARPRSARARTEGNNRRPPPKRVRGLGPRTFTREAGVSKPRAKAKLSLGLGGGHLYPELLKGFLGCLLFCGLF